ncbi:NAD(P)-dependent oxidoreductase [Bythopirellula polymerisocia]|nr:NAD(P)-dependent oxidoreductase [Bythopirellula polymerisocia]
MTRNADSLRIVNSRNGSPLEPVGVIGLGLLGTALCERLLAAGYPVFVYNRTQEKAIPLIELGAHWSDNPFIECDRVVVSLYTSDIVDAVLDKLEPGLRAGQIIIDTTTGDPTETLALGKRLAKSDVHYLESPIAASSEQTRQGEALAIVAGPEEAYHACRDLFDCLAGKSHFVGPWGSAAKMKLVNNLVLGLNRVALAEGLLFAEAIGVPMQNALDVLKDGNAYSIVMDVKGQKMVDSDFSTQAKLSQHTKDVRLMLTESERAGITLPLSNLHLQLLEQAEALGFGDRDNCIIIKAIEEAVRLQAEITS